MHDLISISDLDKKQIEKLLSDSAKMERSLKKGRLSLLSGKIVANLFFEPSTRTNMSFQAAAARLGAERLVFSAEASSAAKGESLSDTIRMVDAYADCIVIRHPQPGSALLAAEVAQHPVINAGDGGNQHPTQTLIDLYTIRKTKGKIAGLNVTLLGDLKHARTMRSLLYALAMFRANITLVSPPGLEMERKSVEEAKRKFGARIVESNTASLKGCDVLYTGRIQKERFASPADAEKAAKEFRVSMRLLESAPKNIIILHPLPKLGEIPPQLDFDPRAKYFEQAAAGVPVRMAVLAYCIGR